jgi:hypothetical protein
MEEAEEGKEGLDPAPALLCGCKEGGEETGGTKDASGADALPPACSELRDSNAVFTSMISVTQHQ